MRFVRWFAGPLVAAGLALGGCSGPPACRRGTLQVSLNYDSTAVQADALTVTVTLPGGPIVSTKTHFPGTPKQDIILDLGAVDLGGGNGYTAGASYTLEVLAKLRGSIIAYGTTQGPLSPTCTLQSLNLAAGAPPDLATPPDLGGVQDQATPADQAALPDLVPPLDLSVLPNG
ncbi:MAG TPA: hypothetical protein VH877_11175 [Polyangia bacterium]|nr:hypothetical protein [Polyangia bacterium]